MVTVLGASGYLGSRIFNSLKDSGLAVRGTYCRNKQEGLFYFDIENMAPEALDPEGDTRYLVIAAALNATIDASKVNWEKARYLNVEKIKRISDYCFLKSITPVYLSTDNVFDGTKGNYREDDARSPLNCYGRMRYEAENHLLNSGKECVILRMGKVFGIDKDDNTLIASMLKGLKMNKELLCADDQVFTPLYAGDLADFVKLTVNQGLRGVFHLASLAATTRYAMAKTIQDYFSLGKAVIKPCKINSLSLLEKRPLLIDLNCAKYYGLTGKSPQKLTQYLGMFN